MKIELNKEILEYVEQNTEAKGFLASCKKILIPYILKNHKESLKEYISLDDIELINSSWTLEKRVLDFDRDIKINTKTFKDIERELIRPLHHSLKDVNSPLILKFNCVLYLENGAISKFSCCWREYRITNYDYKSKLVCPSLNTY